MDRCDELRQSHAVPPLIVCTSASKLARLPSACVIPPATSAPAPWSYGVPAGGAAHSRRHKRAACGQCSSACLCLRGGKTQGDGPPHPTLPHPIWAGATLQHTANPCASCGMKLGLYCRSRAAHRSHRGPYPACAGTLPAPACPLCRTHVPAADRYPPKSASQTA